MIQENKELLMKDLCARLPYGVIVDAHFDKDKILTREMGLGTLHDFMFDDIEVKPYLRSISNMTKKEKKELKELHFYYTDAHIINDEDSNFKPIIVDEIHCSCIIDWLNSHFFDYRGLIKKNLAIEAPKKMYKNK